MGGSSVISNVSVSGVKYTLHQWLKNKRLLFGFGFIFAIILGNTVIMGSQEKICDKNKIVDACKKLSEIYDHTVIYNYEDAFNIIKKEHPEKVIKENCNIAIESTEEANINTFISSKNLESTSTSFIEIYNKPMQKVCNEKKIYSLK
ncbi:MAG: hypothetical protein RIQ94_2077 [Pseudomonadota bacterium]